MDTLKSPTRILYVDDEQLTRSAFSIQFKRFGYKIDLAPSGADAVKLVEKNAYPLVVTDLRMPGMGGLELVERLRALSPDTAFIVVTGLPELDLARDSFHDEAIVAVHPKPWDVAMLHDAIERGLAYNVARSSTDLKLARRAVVISADASLSETIVRELEADDFHVAAPATSVAAALDKVRTAPSLIVAELSTLVPPRFHALEQLREASPSTAILVITDERNEVIARQSLAQGAIDYCFAHELESRSFHRAVGYAVDRRESDLKVAELRRQDGLTGLLGHAAFRAAVSKEIETGGTFGLAVVGLDRFGAINDSLGHDAGDAFLREFSRRLTSCVHERAVVGRIGSDEFAVLCRGVETGSAMVEWAERLLQSMRESIVVSGVDILPTASVGVTTSRSCAADADVLLRQSGVAMRFAKQGGRSKVHLINDCPTAAPSRLSLESELRDALENQRFVLHYQPQRDLRTGTVRGAEALIRMKRTDGTLVPPNQFIPVLEDTDMIFEVSTWVIEEACRKIAEWHRAGHPEICVAVNLSARQFEREGLVKTVLEATNKAGIEPSSLELEITEGLLMKDTELANATLRGLKELGTRIAIDDFGTGYSSLSYLNRFAVDVVKIDRSFVRTIGKEVAGGSIASAIVGLGHRLGLEVVGEGIETQEELAFLRNEGCDIAQGFLLGRPAELWSPRPEAAKSATITACAV